jgi:uncharacterized protein (TIGR02594 family)
MVVPLQVTALSIGRVFLGTSEVPGAASNPAILAMLKLDQSWPGGDEVPWCSAYVNYVCFLLGLPRSKSLAARSWLKVGAPVSLTNASPGFDVVVLTRGTGAQPGPDVLAAPGHVGFYLSAQDSSISILAGNQGNRVSEQNFPLNHLLGIRRLR